MTALFVFVFVVLFRYFLAGGQRTRPWVLYSLILG